MEIEEHILIRSFRGKTPKVHPKAFVSEFAYVIGDVEIGENSSIWPGTVVRGDGDKITIGKTLTCKIIVLSILGLSGTA